MRIKLLNVLNIQQSECWFCFVIIGLFHFENYLINNTYIKYFYYFWKFFWKKSYPRDSQYAYIDLFPILIEEYKKKKTKIRI